MIYKKHYLYITRALYETVNNAIFRKRAQQQQNSKYESATEWGVHHPGRGEPGGDSHET